MSELQMVFRESKLMGAHMHISKRLAIRAGVAVLSSLMCFAALADGYVNFYEWRSLPSIMSDVWHHPQPYTDTEYVSCYSIYDGSQLNCPYTLQLKGIDTGTDPEVMFSPPLTKIQIYGGHDHNYDTHPFYWVPSSVIYPLDVQGGPYSRPDNVTVQGNTDFSETKITFTYPETAGSIWLETNVASPPGWYCVTYCYDFYTWRYHETILVGDTDFEQLDPNGGADYVVARGGLNGAPVDTNHLDANAVWGLPYTLQVLRGVANLYHIFTPWHAKLSINDISLVEGGVFDVHLGWVPPHQDHRLGIAFDVNRADAQNISDGCNGPYYFLRDAVAEENFVITDGAETYNYKRPTDLYCETGGRIHINAFPYNPPWSVLQLFQE